MRQPLAPRSVIFLSTHHVHNNTQQQHRLQQIDKNVEREILNHRMLNNPHVIGFREVFLTPTHLCIAMEYAAGGELFDRIVRAGRFSEDEARYFFQQLICGIDYCHRSVRFVWLDVCGGGGGMCVV